MDKYTFYSLSQNKENFISDTQTNNVDSLVPKDKPVLSQEIISFSIIKGAGISYYLTIKLRNRQDTQNCDEIVRKIAKEIGKRYEVAE